jgi:hypothetical protein
VIGEGVPASAKYRRAKTDVLEYQAMRPALRGREVLFYVAGYVASSPVERVWEVNAGARWSRSKRPRPSAYGG